MNILIISQYFWPENFRINDIATDLAKKGHDVTVLTGKPNYPGGIFFKGYSMFNNSSESWNNIKIIRSPLISRGKGGGLRLFLNYISFAVFASVRAFSLDTKIDKIFVYEPSPITVGIPAIAAKKRTRAPIYFWVQDLWPESLSAAGGINNKMILKIADWITRKIYQHSAKILVQSKGFNPYLVKQGVPPEKLFYFPNTTESFYVTEKPSYDYSSRLPEGFKLMFAGNIGQGQSFDTLLRAAKILKEENLDIKWIILGDGRMKKWVFDTVNDLNLNECFYLLGSFPAEEMPHFFACSDAMIVSLKRNRIFALTIPAKVQSYLACGKPVIGSIDGEGARIIEESGAGLCAPAEDAAELANCIKKTFMMSEKERAIMGSNGRSYYEREFDREMLLGKLVSLLSE